MSATPITQEQQDILQKSLNQPFAFGPSNGCIAMVLCPPGRLHQFIGSGPQGPDAQVKRYPKMKGLGQGLVGHDDIAVKHQNLHPSARNRCDKEQWLLEVEESKKRTKTEIRCLMKLHQQCCHIMPIWPVWVQAVNWLKEVEWRLGYAMPRGIPANKVPPSPETAEQIGWQLLEVLRHLEDHKVVNGDIKPPNMILLPNAQGEPHRHLKVIDFGMAGRQGAPYNGEGTEKYGLPNLPFLGVVSVTKNFLRDWHASVISLREISGPIDYPLMAHGRMWRSFCSYGEQLEYTLISEAIIQSISPSDGQGPRFYVYLIGSALLRDHQTLTAESLKKFASPYLLAGSQLEGGWI